MPHIAPDDWSGDLSRVDQGEVLPPAAFRGMFRALMAGRPVRLVDDENGSSALFAAADRITATGMASLIRGSSGYACVAIPAAEADRLALPQLPTDREGAALGYCVAVDAAAGTTTGISAHDRALTANVLADARSTAEDLDRPGHMVPVRVRADGCAPRMTVPQAALAAVSMAGGRPAAVYALLADPDVLPASSGPDDVGIDIGLITVTVSQISRQMRAALGSTTQRTDAVLELPAGRFLGTSYRFADGARHVVFRPVGHEVVPRRDVAYLHRECSASALFGSVACTCEAALQGDLRGAAAHGGVVIFSREAPAGATQLTAHHPERAVVVVGQRILPPGHRPFSPSLGHVLQDIETPHGGTWLRPDDVPADEYPDPRLLLQP